MPRAPELFLTQALGQSGDSSLSQQCGEYIHLPTEATLGPVDWQLITRKLTHGMRGSLFGYFPVGLSVVAELVLKQINMEGHNNLLSPPNLTSKFMLLKSEVINPMSNVVATLHCFICVSRVK